MIKPPTYSAFAKVLQEQRREIDKWFKWAVTRRAPFHGAPNCRAEVVKTAPMALKSIEELLRLIRSEQTRTTFQVAEAALLCGQLYAQVIGRVSAAGYESFLRFQLQERKERQSNSKKKASKAATARSPGRTVALAKSRKEIREKFMEIRLLHPSPEVTKSKAIIELALRMEGVDGYSETSIRRAVRGLK